jgi:hypothetical protein
MRKIETEYFCDNCGASVSKTPMGSMYGPICMQVTAPAHSLVIANVDFCGTNCASLWIENKMPEILS